MLIGKKLKLRPTTSKDLEIFRQWINDWEVCQGLLRYLPVSDFEHKEWFKKIKKEKNQIYFSIEKNKSMEYIGNIGLKNINWKDRNGEFFIYLGEKKERGLGYGSEAVKIFVDYCFNALNLHKIILNVIEHNKSAIKAYLNNGFCVEGILQQEFYQNGKYHNIIRMGIINKKIA